MSTFFIAVAAVLLLNILVGLWRVVHGPDQADRLVSANLFGTTGAATLLLLAEEDGGAPLRDVAVVLVVLAIVATAVFVTRVPTRGGGR
jgi:multicomponent Na+:H+ antiporter subunit F